MEHVIIGCKLPTGYLLEVGYEVVTSSGAGERPQYRRLPSYKSYLLRGSNAHNTTGLQLPAMQSRTFINTDVPKDLWDQWKKEHPNNYLLKSGILFESKDEPSAKAQAIDVAKVNNGFEPLDQKEVVVPGVAKASFDEKAP